MKSRNPVYASDSRFASSLRRKRFCFVCSREGPGRGFRFSARRIERWDREGKRGGRRRPEEELVISGGVGYWWNYGGFICILICVL